jgi:hypothetical protein
MRMQLHTQPRWQVAQLAGTWRCIKQDKTDITNSGQHLVSSSAERQSDCQTVEGGREFTATAANMTAAGCACASALV